MIDTYGILKICKVLAYKVGLTYKRMDIYFNDLRKEFKKDTELATKSFGKELSQINEMVH